MSWLFVIALAILSNHVQITFSDQPNIRLVQYNVEWLFIDYYANAKCPGSGCPWSNQSQAETHLQYVSNVIKELKPDIVNFCEVEGINELNMVANGSYKTYLKPGTDTSTGQNVGLLTKIAPTKDLYRTEARYNYPIPASKCGYTGEPGTSGVSKHYITEFRINNIDIALIAAHLLAFPTDKTRCTEREAQAQVLQQVIYGYYERDYEIIVLGDFNDFDGETVDANDNIPISQVLDILKGYRGDYASKYKLVSIAETIQKTDRFSDWYDENNNCISTSTEFSMIDHILVTEKIQNSIVNSFFYHNYDEFCGTYNSDHYPLVIDMIL
jgi:exonuclease III